MIKIGVLVNNLSPSQLNYYIIKNCNRWIDQNPKDDIIVFAQNPALSGLTLRFATYTLSELYGFDGIVVSTSLDLAKLAQRAFPVYRHIHYANDLEWLRFPNRDYEPFRDVYRNPRMEMVVRGEDHRQMISMCWNLDYNKIRIAPNFELEKVIA